MGLTKLINPIHQDFDQQGGYFMLFHMIEGITTRKEQRQRQEFQGRTLCSGGLWISCHVILSMVFSPCFAFLTLRCHQTWQIWRIPELAMEVLERKSSNFMGGFPSFPSPHLINPEGRPQCFDLDEPGIPGRIGCRWFFRGMNNSFNGFISSGKIWFKTMCFFSGSPIVITCGHYPFLGRWSYHHS